MTQNIVQNYGEKSVWLTSGDYASDQTESGSLYQIPRVISADWSATYPLEDDLYLNGGAESSYRFSNGIDLNLRWLITNAETENVLGIIGTTTKVKQTELEQEKNIYLSIQDDQMEAINASVDTNKTILGFAQGVITQYGFNARIGNLAEGSATINFVTAKIYTGVNGVSGQGIPQVSPAVNYQNGDQLTGLSFIIPEAESKYSKNSSSTSENILALGSKDIQITFPSNNPFGLSLTEGNNSCYLQSLSLNLAIDRKEQKPLGYTYPVARPIIYPIRVDLTTETIVSRYQSDELQRLTNCDSSYSFNVTTSQCGKCLPYRFEFDNMKIVDQSFSSSIGSYDSVSTKWRGFIKNPNETSFTTTKAGILIAFFFANEYPDIEATTTFNGITGNLANYTLVSAKLTPNATCNFIQSGTPWRIYVPQTVGSILLGDFNAPDKHVFNYPFSVPKGTPFQLLMNVTALGNGNGPLYYTGASNCNGSYVAS